MQSLKIYIADDYFLIREGIKKSLKSLREANIVGESSDLSNLIHEIASCKPDILIIEVNLCKRPFHELIREIKTVSFHTKILVISDCNCELPVVITVRAGVSGFLKKNVTKDELIKAIVEISEGREYFSFEIAKILMKELSNNMLMTEREMEILKLICLGLSNEVIASKLFISENTIATHKRNIMRKASVNKTSDLILWALNNNLIPSNK